MRKFLKKKSQFQNKHHNFYFKAYVKCKLKDSISTTFLDIKINILFTKLSNIDYLFLNIDQSWK